METGRRLEPRSDFPEGKPGIPDRNHCISVVDNRFDFSSHADWLKSDRTLSFAISLERTPERCIIHSKNGQSIALPVSLLNNPSNKQNASRR
jgi:hypothetical protein